MLYRGLVITGTDTGVGKTALACAIAGLLNEVGRKPGVLKPVETGCEPNASGALVPADAVALAAAAGYRLSGLAGKEGLEEVGADLVVPWRFADPLAPEEAARKAGARIEVDRVYQAMDFWMERGAEVVVETAGGVLVPLSEGFSFLDLMQGLELPAIVVAANRLGTINHTLLTLQALRSRGVTPVAVILNQLSAEPDLSAETNAEVLGRHGGVPVYETPFSECAPAETAKLALREAFPHILRAVEEDWRRVKKNLGA